jgi:hypothetical protein
MATATSCRLVAITFALSGAPFRHPSLGQIRHVLSRHGENPLPPVARVIGRGLIMVSGRVWPCRLGAAGLPPRHVIGCGYSLRAVSKAARLGTLFRQHFVERRSDLRRWPNLQNLRQRAEMQQRCVARSSTAGEAPLEPAK